MTSKARQLADLGGDTANLETLAAGPTTDIVAVGNAYSDGALSNRNLIINGAMQVAQRGTSFTDSSGSFTYKLDRFVGYNTGSSTVTYTQATDAPNDFKYSMKATVDVAGTPDQQYILTSFEGQNMTQLNFGSSAAKPITLSFWVKASIAGTYNIALRSDNASLGGTFVKEYVINSANTWEYKTVTITGRTSGTWATDNTNWGYLFFNFSVGTTYDDGVDGEWVNSDERGTANQVQLVETQGATFQITGVQLEVGSADTPFEHKTYGQDLALCQRYYETSNTNGQRIPYIILAFYNAGDARGHFQWQVEKRATPTVTYNGANWNLYGSGGGLTDTGAESDGISTKGVCFVITGSGFPSGQAGFADNRTNDAIVADAEL